MVKTDYAKWMLDDPRVNFAISTRGRTPGLDHLGIQVEDKTELHEVYARLREAGGPVIEQGETACCYAKSEKSWIARVANTKACCVPAAAGAAESAAACCTTETASACCP